MPYVLINRKTCCPILTAKPPQRARQAGVSVVRSPILTLPTTHSPRSAGRFQEAAVFDHEMVRQVPWNEFDIEAARVKPTE